MSFIKNAKIALVAAALSLVGSVASAATISVADASAGGFYRTYENASGDQAIDVLGAFEIVFDPAFDPTVTRTFVVEASLSATDLPEVNETLVVNDVTGLELLSYLGSTVGGLISPVFPSDVLVEVLDGDIDQTEVLPGLYFGFDFFGVNFSLDKIDGFFEGVVSAGSAFGPDFDRTGLGFFDAELSIAAVPLPASGLLLIGALAGVGVMRRRKQA